MKNFLKGLLFFSLFIALTGTYADAVQGVDFYTMIGTELQAVIEDAKLAESAYHYTPSSTQSVLRDLTEEKVEAYYASSGIEVSWPWFGYVYTRDWDFYTLSTHVKYNKDGRQETPVYAEIFGYSTQPDLYYLEVGGTVLVDRRSEIPPSHWLAEPGAMINDETGINLSLLNGAELAELKSEATQEIKNNHTPKTSVTKQIREMTKDLAEEYFNSAGKKTSWPRLGYDFTCEWNLYTMTATIKADREKLDVLSEAFPVDNQYSIVYLEIGGQVVKDRRDLILLPEKKTASASEERASTEVSETSSSSAMQDGNDIPVFMSAPSPGADEPVATPVALWTPEPTPEQTPVPTQKPVPESIHLEPDMEGDLVKKVQRRLKDIGYLAGEVDGYYGDITYWTVWIWQGDNGLPVTGEINDAEMRLLFPEEYE